MNNGICKYLHDLIGSELYEKFTNVYPEVDEKTTVRHFSKPDIYQKLYGIADMEIPITYGIWETKRGVWDDDTKVMNFILNTRFAMAYMGNFDIVAVNDHYTYKWEGDDGKPNR